LSSVELNFLKYIDARNVATPNIAGYWTHEYNINYQELISQCMYQGLLEINDCKNLSTLTVVKLKEILSSKNLVKTGKKIDLVERIEQSFTSHELEKYLKSENSYFKLTQKGVNLTSVIKPSATKNLALEDKCYILIMSNKINEAYKEIAKFESEKPIPRGMGIDWIESAKNGLLKCEFINYTDHLNLNQDLPDSLIKYKKQLNATVILGSMLGVSYDKTTKMFNRLCETEIDSGIILKHIHTNSNYIYAKRDILSYLDSGVDNYKYLCTLDLSTCKECGTLDGQTFKVRQAEFGINYPPICDSCRCTTVPYYDDTDCSEDTRVARDPVTGKSYEVPSNMDYDEWYQIVIDKYGQEQ